MADLARQRETLWLSAMRQIGQHFTKIGDIILKCAEDTENLAGTVPGSQLRSPYGRGTGEEPTAKRRKRGDERLRGPALSPYRPVTGGPLSHQRAKYTSPKGSSRFARPAPRDPATQLGQPGDDDEDDEDLTLTQRFYARRRTAPSASDRQSSEDRYRRESGQLPPARGRASRTSKRVRVNWTDAENSVFFDTIRRFSTEDDSSVLHKIVAALGGSRTLLQCKGHFRNLLFVGKVIHSDTEPRRWIVVEEPLEQKRSSLGGRSLQTDSKNSRSSAASREESQPGGKERDDPDDPGLRESQHEQEDRGQSSQHAEKPVDDEHDVVLDEIEDDDDRDKDYQDEEDEDEDEDNEGGEENESGTNTTAIRVTDVGEIDPGGGATEFESRGLGGSLRSIEGGSKTSMPLKKQPGGRVGEVARAHALDDKELS